MEQAVKASDHTKRYLVIPSGGSGVRMGADLPKQYIKLGGKTILQHTVEALSKCVDYIVIGISYEYRIIVEDMLQHWQAKRALKQCVGLYGPYPTARSSAYTMRYALSSLRKWWTNATKRLSEWVLLCLSYSSRRAYATSPTKGQEHNLRKL